MTSIKYAVSCCAALIFTLITTAFAQDFEPKYIGEYPTKETAERMFEEYDYQAAVQFYIWAYAYLNNMGMEKGFAKMGGDERSFYIFSKRFAHNIPLLDSIKFTVFFSFPVFWKPAHLF